MNPTNCTGCAAPLDPLAPKCAYCGVVTPRGRADAERADYDARQRQAGQAAYASIAHAHASQNVSKNATIALVLSIAGLVTCCSPFGWIALLFVYLSVSAAKKHGIPAPVTAKVAGVIALLGTLVSAGVLIASHFDQKDKEKRIAALEARSAKGRAAEVLDAKTACDVTEAYFLKTGKMYVSSEIACTGKLDVQGSTARLDGVAIVNNGKKTDAVYRVCLARGARWFLIHADTTKDECLDEAPEANGETAEQVARDDYPALLEGGRVHTADKRLAAVKAAVSDTKPAEKTCNEAALAAALGKEKSKVATARTIDFAALDGKDDPDFAFLSSADLLRYVQGGAAKKPVAARSDDARAVLSEPLLVVYKHKAREAAEITDKGAKAATWGLTPGSYDGTLYVVDAGRGAVLCQGPLAFATPSKPTFSLSRSSTKGQVETRARLDLEQRFHDAATARMKELTAGKVGLGYKPLE